MVKALVLISGGIDSSVALYWALQQGIECQCLTFVYEGQAEAEREAVDFICRSTGTYLYTTSHPRLSGKDLLTPDNLLYYSVAISFARKIGCDTVIGGQNMDDLSEARKEARDFYSLLNKLIDADYEKKKITVVQPLICLTKNEVIKMGLRLKVPLKNTWSCQSSGPDPCFTCSSCINRNKAFKELGVIF